VFIPGGFGVTVFFFLSGFLITTLLRVEFDKRGRISFSHFWIRRSLRILPPLYLVLLGTIVATAVFYPPGTLTLPAVAARALQFTNYWIIFRGDFGGPIGTGVYWSLAVEEHFYLLFPFLYLVMRRLRLPSYRQALIIWGFCVLILLWRCVLVWMFHASVNRTYLSSDTRIDGILFGCALAVWRNPTIDPIDLNELRWKYVYAPASVLLLLICLFMRNEPFRETARYSLQGVALTFIFIAAIRFPQWPPFRFLNWPPFAFIGVLSYSLYLMHYAVIYGIRSVIPIANVPVQAIAALITSIVLALLIYRWVERPCAKLRKRFTD
jgi:peptidoglycan/LPS O-acetylase OafA/YrhL